MNSYWNNSSSEFNANYWDRVANEKIFGTPIPMDEILKFIRKDEPVLDFGCGYGRALKELWARGYTNLFGVESSQEMTKLASATLNGNASITHSDQSPTPYQDDSFQAVLLFAVLTSITELDSEEKVLNDIYRILKPGGYLFVIDNCVAAYREDRYRYFEDSYGKYALFDVSTGDAQMKHNTNERFLNCFKNYSLVGCRHGEWQSMNGNPDSGLIGLFQKPKE